MLLGESWRVLGHPDIELSRASCECEDADRVRNPVPGSAISEQPQADSGAYRGVVNLSAEVSDRSEGRRDLEAQA